MWAAKMNVPLVSSFLLSTFVVSHLCLPAAVVAQSPQQVRRVTMATRSKPMTVVVVRDIMNIDKPYFNPLKPSGAKWLHLKASRAILV